MLTGRSSPRTVRLGGRQYTVSPPSIRDPRLHVAAVLLTLQVLGQTVLNFRLSVAQILACLITGALIEFVVAFLKDHAIMWPASGLLTGNSVAIILRVPGTVHGQWWSQHGIEIFILVVAVSMASKYIIRWRGRHIFNPSNLGLVLAFVVLGPLRTEPQDLWWIPLGPWLIVTYVLLIGGGLWVGARLGLLGMQLAFMTAFAVFLAVALAPVPDHCMVASWRLAPICGQPLWLILVTSPEVLVFGLFMLPDPRTVPEGRTARILFGGAVALFSVLLLGPTILEFWTKTAILASLVVACGLRVPLASVLEPANFQPSWRAPALIALASVCFGLLPLAADLSTRSPQPSAGLADGSTPPIPLTVGDGPDIALWMTAAASRALPPSGPRDRPAPTTASAQIWHLPAVPAVSIPTTIKEFDPGLTPQVAAQMTHDLVLDLIIEAEARRTLDPQLAESGARVDGLKVFTDDIRRDRSAGVVVTTSYRFDRASLVLFLPKFSTQAPRLVGITLNGTAALTTRDRNGNSLSQTTEPYARSWGVSRDSRTAQWLIINDFSDLRPAG